MQTQLIFKFQIATSSFLESGVYLRVNVKSLSRSPSLLETKEIKRIVHARYNGQPQTNLKKEWNL